jgi:hypothetical protein
VRAGRGVLAFIDVLSRDWTRGATALAWVIGIAAGCDACSLMTSLSDLAGGGGGDAGSALTALEAGTSGEATPGPFSGGDSGTQGGGDDAGSPPPGDAAGGASADGPGDAPAPLDASGDSGVHIDAAATSFCASLIPAPLFCDDFDEGALATPWDQVTGTNGSAALSTSASVSSPEAMLAKVTAQAKANNIDVAAYKSFPAKQGASGVCTLAFDMRIDAGDTSSASDALLAGIQLWNGSASWALGPEVFYNSSSGAFDVSLTEDSPTTSTTHVTSTSISLGVWTHVEVALVLPAASGGATEATLSLDGAEAVAAIVHVTTSNPIPEAIAGITYATPTAAGWAVRYDNVTFDEL